MTILNKKKIQENPKNLQRRDFLKYAGFSAGVAGLVLAACKKSSDNNPAPTSTGTNLGSGDVGILNYAYALEQLEAPFYTQVIGLSNFKTIFTSATEQQILTDIQAHEVTHREFFKAALSTNAIGALTVNFSSIDFTTRTGILTAAKTFEDLGVAAYNGAGKLITTPAYLVLAGKIVSVEARHASVIRDLLSSTQLDSPDFAGDDVVNATSGLDNELCPSAVLEAAGKYITTSINASNLPSC